MIRLAICTGDKELQWQMINLVKSCFAAHRGFWQPRPAPQVPGTFAPGSP
ncbi:MAG: hypothetical protein Q4B48_01280 [Syntrophomonadaceae bacterium]|nr:hypothetical protein [Syntrophomonadaceae bacterium]